MQPLSLTGNLIASAGLIVAALAYFGIIVEQNMIVEIISGGIALYGLIHQFAVTKKFNSQGLAKGILQK